jgi:hypothetical protein
MTGTPRGHCLRQAALAGWLSVVVATAAAGQGGVDALSRKARADSIRRAQRNAAAKGAAAAPAAKAPPAAKPSAPVAKGGAAPAAVAKAPARVAAPKPSPKGGVRAPVAGGAPAAASRVAAPAAAGPAAAPAAAAPVTTPAAPPASTVAPSPSPAPSAPATPSVTPAPAPTNAATTPPSAATTPGAAVAPPARARPTLLAGPALSARQVDSVRARWAIEEPVVWVVSPLARRVSPGLGFATPSGYGPSWGDFFLSTSYQQRTRFTTRQDGSFGIGMGLGDPIGAIGGELVYSSGGTVRSGFFSNGTLSGRVHRIIRGYGVTAGLENVVAVGRTTSGGPDGGRSAYVAVSRLVTLGGRDSVSQAGATSGSELLWTIGLGDGRFRREADVFASRSTVNVFGSLGWRFLERAAAILDYTGQDVSAALSLAPFRCIPLVITPGVADITRSAGDGARFVLAIGLSTRFDRDAFFRRPCTP